MRLAKHADKYAEWFDAADICWSELAYPFTEKDAHRMQNELVSHWPDENDLDRRYWVDLFASLDVSKLVDHVNNEWDNYREAAYERSIEDYYGGDHPRLEEALEEARKLK